MSRRSYQLDGDSAVEINISPLIDIVFLLLIFFLVTAVFVEESGLDVQKPQALSAQQADRMSLQIAIGPEGRIVVGSKDVKLGAVRGIVRRYLDEHNVPVLLQADRHAPTGILVDVYDECKLGGAERVMIATSKEAP